MQYRLLALRYAAEAYVHLRPPEHSCFVRNAATNSRSSLTGDIRSAEVSVIYNVKYEDINTPARMGLKWDFCEILYSKKLMFAKCLPNPRFCGDKLHASRNMMHKKQ